LHGDEVPVDRSDPPKLVREVHRALSTTHAGPIKPKPEPLEPAVKPKRSVFPVCAEPTRARVQPVQHFVDCIRHDPPATPDFSDGDGVQEVLGCSTQYFDQMRRSGITESPCDKCHFQHRRELCAIAPGRPGGSAPMTVPASPQTVA